MSVRVRATIAAICACLLSALCVPSVAGAYPVSEDVQTAIRLLGEKDYRGSIVAADRALKANPSDPVALATRGNAYVELGDYQLALVDQDAVLAMVGDAPGALTNACWVRALADIDLDRARDYCDKAVAKRPGLATFDTRGFLDVRQGEFEAAIDDYDHALKIKPKTASPLYARGVAKIRLGRVAEGQGDIAAAVRIQGDIAEVYARRGLTP